jgi:hypothetical protein
MVLLLLLIPIRVGWRDGSERVGLIEFTGNASNAVSIYHSAKYARGMYAVRVMGRLPEEIEAKLEESNIKYRPRDLTDMD